VKPPKRLIVCCDGTWNRADSVHPTNVLRLHEWLAEHSMDGVVQKKRHFDGVGTRFGEQILGGMVGAGLSEKIKDAYRFLVEFYEPGDTLFFFGFSRGAYTVRSLAGLVRKAGLLRRTEHTRIDDAYRLYRSEERPDGDLAKRFRERYSHDTRIRCIGVWDTVGALGVPTGWASRLGLNRAVEFHDVQLSTSVDFAFQALAIDERRKPFAPTLWEQQTRKLEDNNLKQVLEQAWFSGVHTDVGGGGAQAGLSDHALLWMKRCAERAGLTFHPDSLAELAPDSSIPIHNELGLLYSLWSAYDRPLGKSWNERLHETALERHARDDAYRPPELERYLRLGPAPIFS
jgi:uncharacterized protein (DUF2235 family)